MSSRRERSRYTGSSKHGRSVDRIIFTFFLNYCDWEETVDVIHIFFPGVFILVAIGIGGGIILIIIEITYKRQQVIKQRQVRVSRMAFDRWRRTIEASGIWEISNQQKLIISNLFDRHSILVNVPSKANIRQIN